MADEKTLLTIKTYNHFAKNYQDKFMDMDLYDDTYDAFCELIPLENPEILEIATGPGNVTRAMMKRRPDFRIFGIDMAPNMIELAKANNPACTFEVMDCRDISGLNRKFDAIMCAFCLPYLSKEDAAQLIHDAGSLLNAGGVLYISTMEDEYSRSGFQKGSFSGEHQVYIYYHQKEHLTEVLADCGFSVPNVFYKDYPEADGSLTKDLILITRKLK